MTCRTPRTPTSSSTLPRRLRPRRCLRRQDHRPTSTGRCSASASSATGPTPAIVVTVDLLIDRRRHPRPGVHRLPAPGQVPHPVRADARPGHPQGTSATGKSHFTVFDCFDGTLLEYFKNATGITVEPPEGADTNDRGDHRGDLAEPRPRLQRQVPQSAAQRIDKEMTGEARGAVRRFIPDGDWAVRQGRLPKRLAQSIHATMQTFCGTRTSRSSCQLPRGRERFHRRARA